MINLGRYYRVIAGVLGLQESDIWLASFPRCGSTWIRTIIAHIIQNQYDSPKTNLTKEEIRGKAPTLGRQSLLEVNRKQEFPIFIKTHFEYKPLLFSVPKNCVLIIRDPKDIMASYYQFLYSQMVPKPTFSKFIRNSKFGVLAFINHYNSWVSHANFIIRFEDMKRDPNHAINNMLLAYGLSVKNDIIDMAIEASSINKMRGIWHRSINKGQQGKWKDFFSESDLEWYQEIAANLNFMIYQ